MTGNGTGLIVFAHGSRVIAANEAVKVVAGEAARRAGITAYRTAFLELAAPTLAEAVAELGRGRVRRVGVTEFAESGDAEGLYDKYGLSAEHISAAAVELMD